MTSQSLGMINTNMRQSDFSSLDPLEHSSVDKQSYGIHYQT